MRNARFGWVVFCSLAAMLGCRAPSPDWDGTWKMNPSKGNYRGPVITISISADGEYRYEDEDVRNTFRCDGKYRPMPTGNKRTQACVRSSATTLDMTRKENGVMTNMYHWELSPDGNVFASTATALRPSGPVTIGKLVTLRMSGSNDFAGRWLDTSFLQRYADLTIKLDGEYLHIGYPSAGQYVDVPLNGAEAAMHGPAAGITYAVRRAGRRGFLILGKRNGKVVTQGALELSDDGRSMTKSWWNPDKPADKASLVYEKK